MNTSRKGLAGVVTLLLLSLGSLSAFQGTAPVDDRFVEIDGKKEPGKIPDYLVWRTVFKFLADRSKGGKEWESILEEELRAQPKTIEQFYEVAARATAEDAAAQKKIAEVTNELLAEKKSTDNVIAVVRPMELDRRARTLELADAFVAKVNPNDALMVHRWVDDVRGSIKVTVLKSELNYFRLPR